VVGWIAKGRPLCRGASRGSARNEAQKKVEKIKIAITIRGIGGCAIWAPIKGYRRSVLGRGRKTERRHSDRV